jgi:nucleotide-binding universal stress UspA family protein
LAAKVIPQAEDLARAFGAQLVLMTVGSAEVGEVGESSPEKNKETVAKLPAVRYLEQTASAFKSKGINVTWVYKQGTPAREIIAYAADHQMDLIAMATHGAGEVAWVLGSVAEKVVSHAMVPVLLLRVLEAKPPIAKTEFY